MTEERLERALARLDALVGEAPYPLAHALRAVIDGCDANELPAVIAWDLCAAAGVLTRLAAVLSIRAWVDVGAPDEAVNRELIDALRAPSDGHWLRLAQTLSRRTADRDPWSCAIHEALRSSLTERPPGAPRRLAGALDALVSVRNRLVHGDPPSPPDVAVAVALLAGAAEGLWPVATARIVVRLADRVLTLGDAPSEEGEDGAPSIGPKGLPEGEPCLVTLGERALPARSLHPLVCLSRDADGALLLDEVFFLNAGAGDRVTYVELRTADRRDARALGSWSSVQRLFDSIPAPPLPPADRLDFEPLVRAHSHGFAGREEVLAAIEGFIRERPCSYGAVTGVAGRGKSAIFAELYRHHAAAPHAGVRWAFHFCMPSAGRDEPLPALRSLVTQIADAFGFDPRDWLSHDLSVLRDERFPALLRQASASLASHERLVLAVDALDEGRPADRAGIAAVLPASLPPRVVGLVSWRVDEDGRSGVESELAHVPPSERAPIPGADPLPGLTRGATEQLLAESSPRAFHPETLARIWALVSASGDGADPWVLRLVTQSLAAGRTRPDRPESVPTSADAVFDAVWLALPTDHDFLVHRLLLALAVMRDLGDDELFAALFNEGRAPARSPLRPRDIAIVRTAAGKLLRYEGERYGLFHDRLRAYLRGSEASRR